MKIGNLITELIKVVKKFTKLPPTIGAEDMPAIPLNSILEKTMLPSTEKVEAAIEGLLGY